MSLIYRHEDWIENAIKRRIAKKEKYPEPNSEEIVILKKRAEEILPEKVRYFSVLTGFYPTGIKITGAKKRFGSCSGKNSLCFSYLLMRYPDECIDYVVLHEIIHIKHHNHSRDFYELLGRYMPDFRAREKILKY